MNPKADFRWQDTAIFRMLTETIPVLVYVYQGDKVIYVNSAVEKSLGYTREEMVQKNFWDICTPEYQELIRTRGHARLRGEEVPTNYEFQIVKKSGEAIWVDVFFARTEVRGQPMSIVGAYDITEKKRLQEQLKDAYGELELRVQQRTAELRQVVQELTTLNQNMNSVLDNMSDGVMLVFNNGECQFLNPVAERNWKEVLPQIKDKVKEAVLSLGSPKIAQMLSDHIPFKDEEIIMTTSRGPIHFVASGTPIVNDQGFVDRGLIIIRPIQEVHQLVNRFAGAQASYTFDDIITRNPTMMDTIQQARQAASGSSNVLIQGESGTGKEMFAQAIHLASARRRGPFVAVNCGALPRDLVGSELFGYAEGAFTGAKKGGNPGKFELASGGTLFLDEIGDMPFEQQATLLRVIQEKCLTRIGGHQVIPVNVRVICATNQDLYTEMRKGNFRQDLYYRLNVISLHIPPLRQRIEDVPYLVEYFLTKAGQPLAHCRHMDEFTHYSWPGNVRELQNVIERMLHHGHPSSACNLLDFVDKDTPGSAPLPPARERITLMEAHQVSRQQIADLEKKEILRKLEEHNGNISQVARDMKISRSTLYKKMKSYRL